MNTSMPVIVVSDAHHDSSNDGANVVTLVMVLCCVTSRCQFFVYFAHFFVCFSDVVIWCPFVEMNGNLASQITHIIDPVKNLSSKNE